MGVSKIFEMPMEEELPGGVVKKLLFHEEYVSDSFPKAVCACANYVSCYMTFGGNKEGTSNGLEKPAEEAQRIEQMINSTCDPNPDYSITVDKDSVLLEVEKGLFTPYLMCGKAYQWSDDEAIEVGWREYSWLVLEGADSSFEQLPADEQKLTFNHLQFGLFDVSEMSLDILKTLELFTNDTGINNAGALLADENSFPGVEITCFCDLPDEVRSHHNLAGSSLIVQLHRSMSIFRDNYTYESGEKIPEKAFRQVITHALVHRTWDATCSINVSMFPDRIEVTAPGTLLEETTIDSYLNGYIAWSRNPIRANVFSRLCYIEMLPHTKYAYRDSLAKPQLLVHPTSFKVVLPAVTTVENLGENESLVYEALRDDPQSLSTIQDETGLGRDAIISVLNTLIDAGSVESIGSGPATKYRLGYLCCKNSNRNGNLGMRRTDRR